MVSINLPPLSLAIVRFEQARVEGGMLNNIPANERVEKGCNFVIVSTVTRDALQTRPKFVAVDPAVADLRTKMRNLNATFVSQLSVKSGLTSGRRDNVPTRSHRPRG
jgi:predicted acylesterase/phospholipase RssA